MRHQTKRVGPSPGLVYVAGSIRSAALSARLVSVDEYVGASP
jgi:hypothetical protein